MHRTSETTVGPTNLRVRMEYGSSHMPIQVGNVDQAGVIVTRPAPPADIGPLMNEATCSLSLVTPAAPEEPFRSTVAEAFSLLRARDLRPRPRERYRSRVPADWL